MFSVNTHFPNVFLVAKGSLWDNVDSAMITRFDPVGINMMHLKQINKRSIKKKEMKDVFVKDNIEIEMKRKNNSCLRGAIG